ncbi:MAG: hypothetical protein CM15mP65_02510 [Crocinitomicaceae bacterium]|nr:MAG: hypothetical protein CM15mP65_02510 [Crocinitomicaceae bacterium]
MPSLAPSTSVLGIRKAKHLLNRSCFHYSKASLNHYASLTPTQAINELSQNTSILGNILMIYLLIMQIVS